MVRSGYPPLGGVQVRVPPPWGVRSGYPPGGSGRGTPPGGSGLGTPLGGSGLGTPLGWGGGGQVRVPPGVGWGGQVRVPPPGGVRSGYPPGGSGPGTPPGGSGPGTPPRCGQTNKVKLLPSRRTTYAGGNDYQGLLDPYLMCTELQITKDQDKYILLCQIYQGCCAFESRRNRFLLFLHPSCHISAE